MRFGSLREVVPAHPRWPDHRDKFTHLIPVRRRARDHPPGRRDLHLIRMTPDPIYDQMIGMAARALTFSWAQSRRRLTDDWPMSSTATAPARNYEHSHAGI
jgi:glutaconate CoA-transferase subunit A